MKPNKKQRKRREQLVEICPRFNIAGVQYSDYQELKTFRPGIVLKAFWEKNNAFDDRAIKLTYNGTHIGYVPKNNDAQDIMHEMRENGIKLRVVLTSYNKSNPTWLMFVVKVMAPKNAATSDNSTF